MADIKVYGAPWCPDCRRAKQFLGEQRVAYDWIDIDQDEDAADIVREKNDGKQIIPTIVFEDGSVLAEPGNDELARKLGLELKAERSYYDLIIIGGGPAGLASAIYGAREGIDTLVIEKSALGGQSGVTERIDNYPGFPEGVGGAELAERMIAQARRYEVPLLSAVGVKSVERTDDNHIEVGTETGDGYCARAVIVAPGTTYRRLGVPGEDDLIGAGLHFCATCDAPFYKGSKELMVIGGGNSALEEGLFITQFTEKVTLLQFAPELTASQLLQEKVRSQSKIEIHTNTEVTAFEGKGKLEKVLAKDRESGDEMEFQPAGAFIFIGLQPNTAFLESSVDLDDAGFIKTGATLETSLSGVFAAGDARAGSTKQLAAAVGEGVTALLQVRQYMQEAGDVAAHSAAM